MTSTVVNTPIDRLFKDETNPRKPDPARLGLLALSLRKLGFVMPMYATQDGMLLSGHQRMTVAGQLGVERVPVIELTVKQSDVKGINVLFNRCTNDFTAFDTGSKGSHRLSLSVVIDAAEALPDFDGEDWFALDCKNESIKSLGAGEGGRYDKKATVLATSMLRMGIQIPLVVSESGRVVNGIHRLFAAKENGLAEWPVIRIPEHIAEVTLNFLNYLSMDYKVDDEFADLLRYSAYRRPQNNRGAVPKAYRFWANGHRTLPDRDSYTPTYWREFRDLHGTTILDFGAGLGKVAPYLSTKGMDCIDFEPYRIDPDSGVGVPSPEYSRAKAKEFLGHVAAGKRFTSIFLASVLNSVPFPKDRMCVLAIVHALSDKDTNVYGTCRDISDFHYEYGGIRNANYFVFDSEPGVRIGDVMHNPKLQKFHTQDEADTMFKRLWNRTEYWPGGNVFYFRASAPKGINASVLSQALEFEFGLPFSDGSTMGLVSEAKAAFGKRLGLRF